MAMKTFKDTHPNLGNFEITPTSADHVHVSTHEAFFNGVQYSLSFHLHRWNDGKFHVGEQFGKDGGELMPYTRMQNAFYMHRPGVDYNKSYPSDSARKQALRVAENEISQWPLQHELLMAQAELDDREQKLAKKQTELDEAVKLVSKLGQDIITLTDAVNMAQKKVQLLTPAEQGVAS